jgi:hypothetical protein
LTWRFPGFVRVDNDIYVWDRLNFIEGYGKFYMPEGACDGCVLKSDTSGYGSWGTAGGGGYWQAGTDTGDIYYNNAGGGTVGIGTIDPDSQLHVYGTGTFNMMVETPASASPTIRLRQAGHDWSMQQKTDYFTIKEDTAEPFKIEEGAVGNTLVIDSTGRVGIGTDNPQGVLHSVDLNWGSYRNIFEEISGSAWHRADLEFRRARGTLASRQPVVKDDTLGLIRFAGYIGTGYPDPASIAADIRSVVDGAPGTNVPGRLEFRTNNGNGLQTRMNLTSSGDVIIKLG